MGLRSPDQTHLGGYVVQVPIEAFTPKSAEVPGRWEVLWLPMSTGVCGGVNRV